MPAVIMVAGDITGIAISRLARRVAEAIPNRFAAPILVRSTLDLIGGGRCTPNKVLGKTIRCLALRVVNHTMFVLCSSLNRGE